MEGVNLIVNCENHRKNLIESFVCDSWPSQLVQHKKQSNSIKTIKTKPKLKNRRKTEAETETETETVASIRLVKRKCWKILKSRNLFRKPPLSYKQLIAMAIESSPNKQQTVRHIYKFLEEKFDCFKSENKIWKSAVRTNLTQSACFLKLQQKDGYATTGSYWTINDVCSRSYKRMGLHSSRHMCPAKKKNKSDISMPMNVSGGSISGTVPCSSSLSLPPIKNYREQIWSELKTHMENKNVSPIKDTLNVNNSPTSSNVYLSNNAVSNGGTSCDESSFVNTQNVASNVVSMNNQIPTLFVHQNCEGLPKKLNPNQHSDNLNDSYNGNKQKQTNFECKSTAYINLNEGNDLIELPKPTQNLNKNQPLVMECLSSSNSIAKYSVENNRVPSYNERDSVNKQFQGAIIEKQSIGVTNDSQNMAKLKKNDSIKYDSSSMLSAPQSQQNFIGFSDFIPNDLTDWLNSVSDEILPAAYLNNLPTSNSSTGSNCNLNSLSRSDVKLSQASIPMDDDDIFGQQGPNKQRNATFVESYNNKFNDTSMLNYYHELTENNFW